MATPTPRLGLTRDDSGDNYSVSRVNANSTIIDEVAGCTMVTNAAARPTTNLFHGRMIYELDTEAALVWRTDLTPDNWRYIGIPSVANATARDALDPKHDGLRVWQRDIDETFVWNSATWKRLYFGRKTLRGIILNTQYTDLGAGPTNLTRFDLNSLSLTTSQVYWVKFDCQYNSSAFGSWEFRVRKGGSGGPLQFTRMLRVPESGFDDSYSFEVPWQATADEVTSLNLSVARLAGTGVLDIYGAAFRSSFSVAEEVDLSVWSYSS